MIKIFITLAVLGFTAIQVSAEESTTASFTATKISYVSCDDAKAGADERAQETCKTKYGAEVEKVEDLGCSSENGRYGQRVKVTCNEAQYKVFKQQQEAQAQQQLYQN